ncbi:MAG: hypothetical protein Q8N59_02685 [bacterium]|nr:hypothetical protein [bacterium]
MEREKFRPKKGIEIVKARIPDEDLPGWIGTLKDGGFTQEEIDLVISGLNTTYLKERKPEMVERELVKLMREFREEKGTLLTPEEIDYLKAGIESRFKDEAEK